MDALKAVRALRGGDLQVLKHERWLHHLALTEERQVNLERVSSLADIAENPVLQYTERTLQILEELALAAEDRALLQEVLCWCEVAKAGMPHQRRKWLAKGYNLFAHNVGSAQIYTEETGNAPPHGQPAAVLIATHGLIGQCIRGEVPLSHNRSLHDLVNTGQLPASRLEGLLVALNACVIGAVDAGLWREVRPEVGRMICAILAGELGGSDSLRSRLERLRRVSGAQGEDFSAAYGRSMTPQLERRLEALLRNAALWYVEAALFDFTFEEFLKILLLVAVEGGAPAHISFEVLMRSLYREHGGKKRVNLYKKRVIEKYLGALSFAEILTGQFPDNPHVAHRVWCREGPSDTVFFDFLFSAAGEKLIAFCEEAERAGVLYEQAVVLLFDLFGLRRDQFDRFYNEESYLETMNGAMDHKRVLLEDIVGDTVLDVGPGGGGLMDLIAGAFPEKKVVGIDFSQNVVDSLTRRRQLENRPWEVVYGDALRLADSFAPGSVDTVIFCSVLHELYSYIEHEGKKFSTATLAGALRSAFSVLPAGGRILIRDGIMTEPVEQYRRIRFRSAEGMAFLERYARDFAGREIRYALTGQNEVRMKVNDAMEFLYTYTWGEESYVHEVKEQFGYFTPSGYRAFLRETLGEGAVIVKCEHFLQEGYATALGTKVDITDDEGRPADLPDSTCILVVEKGSGV